MEPIYLAGAVRTPIGRFGGSLQSLTAADLGVAAGAIHGQVFNDTNGNAIEQGAEVGVINRTVQLLNPLNNNVIATTTTALDGTYTFANVAPGSDTIVEAQPAGYGYSAQTPATRS